MGKGKILKKNKTKSKVLIGLLLLIVAIIVGVIFINKDENVSYSQIYGGKIEEDFLADIYISEENYINNIKEIVEPYLEEYMEEGYFEGKESASIYYKKYMTRSLMDTNRIRFC